MSVVYRGGYHDHANIVSMIGCPRVKQVHWLSDPVLSLLTGNWAQAESFTCPTERGSARLILPLDHRYRSRRVQWGFRDHYRGREVVSAGGSCGAGDGVTPFGGNDTGNGACSGGRSDRLSRASCNAAAVAIALLDNLRLEGQWPSDAMECLPRRKN